MGAKAEEFKEFERQDVEDIAFQKQQILELLKTSEEEEECAKQLVKDAEKLRVPPTAFPGEAVLGPSPVEHDASEPARENVATEAVPGDLRSLSYKELLDLARQRGLKASGKKKAEILMRLERWEQKAPAGATRSRPSRRSPPPRPASPVASPAASPVASEGTLAESKETSEAATMPPSHSFWESLLCCCGRPGK